MTQKFKSDARPSDTKSVVLHKENDKRLLDHLKTIKRESEWWRAAGNFYLDFTEWLAAQPDAPLPGRPFIFYQSWLENRLPPSPSGRGDRREGGEGLDPDDLAAALLPGVRSVVEAALAGLKVTGAPMTVENEAGELENEFSDNLVLEL